MYLYIKAVHVFAVVTFIGGLLLSTFALRFVADTSSLAERERMFLQKIMKWDSTVTAPALGAVWIAGFTMAFGAQWFDAPWLMVKMIPVVFLSALHGMMAGALRRNLRDGKPVAPWMRHAPAMILVALAVIVCLVVLKPF